jgi:Beta-lactamase enzyme family
MPTQLVRPAALPWSRSFLDPKAAAVSLNFSSRSATAKYDAAIKKLRTQLARPPESLCVIDMSAPGAPILAGWNLDRPLQISSMAKLALLVAAAQLRDDVQATVRWAGITKWRDVVPALTRAWQKGKAPEFKALGAGAVGSLPMFDVIFDSERFDAAADAVPEFRSRWPNLAKHERFGAAEFGWVDAVASTERPTKPPASLKDRDPKAYDRQNQKYIADFMAFYDNVLAPVPFVELLLLAIKWSDNEAASACLSRLGLPFVTAVVRHMGLYDERAQHGLWLGNVYRPLYGSKAFRSPGRPQGKPVFHRIGANAGDDEEAPTSTQVGTARICCLLLAVLVQGTLFEHSNELVLDYLEFRLDDVLDNNIPDNYTLFGSEMTREKKGKTLMHLSKIGILGDVSSDCAYLLHVADASAKASDGSVATPDAALLSRSVAACALHGTDEAVADAGKGILETSDRLGV